MRTELSPENERFIAEQVAAGSFGDREKALDAGVELLKQRTEFLKAIDKGRHQLDTGEFIEYDDEGLRQRFEELKRQALNHSSSGNESL